MSDPETPFRLTDPRLEAIAEKVAAGVRLDREEAITVATTDDVLGVGRLANHVRERLHGDATFFNVNRHLNPTNVCTASTASSAASTGRTGDKQRLDLDARAAVETRCADVDEPLTEVHIVGGHNPDLPSTSTRPDPRHPETSRFPGSTSRPSPWPSTTSSPAGSRSRSTRSSTTSSRPVSARCPAAAPRCSSSGCAARSAPQEDRRASAGSRSPATSTAHGLRSNGTMLYGHIETARSASSTCAACASCRTRRRASCASSRSPSTPRTPRSSTCPRPGVDDLLTIAISRLMLDNFPTSRPTGSCSESTAQVALNFGADDLDGTIVDERITRAAGGQAGTGMGRDHLERLIREAGRAPILRDTLYRAVEPSKQNAPPSSA